MAVSSFICMRFMVQMYVDNSCAERFVSGLYAVVFVDGVCFISRLLRTFVSLGSIGQSTEVAGSTKV